MLVQSNMFPLGQTAPDFLLADMNDAERLKSLDDVIGPLGLWVMFVCNHCPYVKHIWSGLIDCACVAYNAGLGVVAISANDAVKFPEDGPQAMQQMCQDTDVPFPYLYDETQAVARAYQAACTPDCYVFDQSKACVYRGRFDAATPGNDMPVTGEAIRHVITALSNKQPVSITQQPSMGCNIKWKDGVN